MHRPCCGKQGSPPSTRRSAPTTATCCPIIPVPTRRTTSSCKYPCPGHALARMYQHALCPRLYTQLHSRTSGTGDPPGKRPGCPVAHKARLPAYTAPGHTTDPRSGRGSLRAGRDHLPAIEIRRLALFRKTIPFGADRQATQTHSPHTGKRWRYQLRREERSRSGFHPAIQLHLPAVWQPHRKPPVRSAQSFARGIRETTGKAPQTGDLYPTGIQRYRPPHPSASGRIQRRVCPTFRTAANSFRHTHLRSKGNRQYPHGAAGSKRPLRTVRSGKISGTDPFPQQHHCLLPGKDHPEKRIIHNAPDASQRLPEVRFTELPGSRRDVTRKTLRLPANLPRTNIHPIQTPSCLAISVSRAPLCLY